MLHLILLLQLVQPLLSAPDQLEGLLQAALLQHKCPRVCEDLNGMEYNECMYTCVQDEEYLCGLETCGFGCLTACFSTVQTESYISRLDIDGCNVSWDIAGDSDFILVGEDVEGIYNILFQGKSRRFLTLENNEEKWRSISLLLIGKTGLEDKQTIQLKHPISCAIEIQGKQTQYFQVTQDDSQLPRTLGSVRVQGILIGLAVSILTFGVISIFYVCVRIEFITHPTVHQTQTKPPVRPTQLPVYPTQTKLPALPNQIQIPASDEEAFHSDVLSRPVAVSTYIRIEDIKIYEDFSLTEYNHI